MRYNIRNIFRKYKIKAKKLYTIIALTILEMVMILWYGNWIPTPIILIPLIQFVAIFENKDIWSRLSEDEKKEITLSEDELDNFVIGIENKIKQGISIEDILIEIKET